MGNICGRCFMTIVTSIIGSLILIISIGFNIDPFEKFVFFLEDIEEYEVDEFIFPVIIILLGVASDFYNSIQKKHKAYMVGVARIKVFEDIMRTTQDIVCNSMNNINLYILEAKMTGKLSNDSIEDLEKIIYSTSDQVRELSIKDGTGEDFTKNIEDISMSN